MGLFLQNHENYETFVKNRTNSTNGANYGYNNGDMASYFVNSGVSIFGTLLQKIGDGKGGDNDGDSKEVSNLNNQLSALLSDIGAKNVSDIDTALTTAKTNSDKKVKENKEKTVDIYTNGTDNYTKEIQKLTAELDALNDNNDPNGQQRQLKNAAIEDIRQKREQAKTYAENEHKKLEAEEAEKIRNLTLKAEEAKAISDRIESIEDPSKYNNTKSEEIKEKTNDFSDFNKARKAFLDNPTGKNFKKLDKAFSNFDNPSQSVITTMKMLKQKYPEFWK